MSLTLEQVKRIAHLARIDTSDGEALTTQGHLNGIFQLIEQMQAVDTEGVEPMSHPLPLVNVSRPDVVRPSLTPADALSGAPEVELQRFSVPRILDEE